MIGGSCKDHYVHFIPDERSYTTATGEPSRHQYWASLVSDRNKLRVDRVPYNRGILKIAQQSAQILFSMAGGFVEPLN